ncbi:MAG: hypothetical protein R3B09_21850 [Nannocystaceae bacterium]
MLLSRLGSAVDIPPEPVIEGPSALAIAAPIVAGVVALLVALALFFRWLKRQMRATGEARIQARFPDGTLRSSPTALFFGLESRGVAQIRGNGALALAADQVWSSAFATQDTIEIPLASIVEVDTCASHLGKRIGGHRLVRIRFRRGDATDAAAWLVDDPEAWRAAIEGARRSGSATARAT